VRGGDAPLPRKTRRISKKEFVERFTELTVRYFSRLSPEEQERRLSAFEKRVAEICRDNVSWHTAGHNH